MCGRPVAFRANVKSLGLSPKRKKVRFRKGRAFPHIKRQSRKVGLRIYGMINELAFF
jgi:hypothetical protein